MNILNKNCDISIFGGHGDLSFRKLLPSLYYLFKDKYLGEKSRILIISRKDISSEDNIILIKNKLKEFVEKEYFTEECFNKFKEMLYVIKVDFSNTNSYLVLKNFYKNSKNEDRINYLSTSPEFFPSICKALSEYKLINDNSRVVLEKPIGRDLESSQDINKEVLKYFDEKQIFRIDHYLGKDTVQNILALRFSNRFIMPLWDSSNIDHVQITVSESVGVEGRWGYYDQYGAMRDMIQNHLMQLLCLIAMEPPCSLEANNIRDEKVKVLRSLRTINARNISENTVRAQYKAGISEGKSVPGYLEGEGVSQSTTETFAAIKVDIDNWRWNGVPFYIRSGKRMQQRNSEIVVHFKEIPHSIFNDNDEHIAQNKLVITLQPKESIKLCLLGKVPGLVENMKLQEIDLELHSATNTNRKNEAYERLILDVINNDPTLFMRLDEVDEAWKWTDSIIQGWSDNLVPMKNYQAGTDGPTAAIQLIAKDGRSWHE
ncbi:MAG: glucose-6-phosphate dehydrogenase [Arcobacter sp.]|nr:glucose-6-phosphate dehydrogenase [Arcobacter sp.]